MTASLLDLGTVEYGKAWELQKVLVERRARDEVPDTLILLEHPHVVTLGRKTSPANLNPQGVPVFTVERGGDATYHGPGQLVGYPIVKLHDHDVRRHVKVIEKALIASVGRFGIEAGLEEGHPGVWVAGRKLASIGVAVTNWVTYHGFALNVNTDMSYFNLIRPCGLDPSTMTSMEMLLGRRLEFAAVRSAVAKEFSSAAGEAFVRQEPAKLPSLAKH
ncbi:MAG: lipoyl(octanoyl) transferase LipB [Nitrososphaerales archaeon]|nr:lipoyl(octanoyl) transferase LipB [Nitrososphaerales archaeon]